MPAQPARETARTEPAAPPPYRHGTLAAGIRSRTIAGVNGLTVHILGAGHETPERPAVLLHGFPELADRWRKVMLPPAAGGYHVIAPAQRGSGRTTGWDGAHHADPRRIHVCRIPRLPASTSWRRPPGR